jgi:replicative DNA helicase
LRVHHPTDISPLARVVWRVDAVADGEPSDDAFATGFPSIDRCLGGGMRRGDLIVLGGDVGAGKSSLALALALRMSEAGRKVLFVTSEMSADRVMERALAIEGRIRVDTMWGGTLDERARTAMGAAAVRLRNRMPAIEVLTGGAVGQVAALLASHSETDVVVVDALQSLTTGRSGLDDELAAAVRDLKALALTDRVAVFATSHVPGLRREEGRIDRRPHLDDFGACGAVKQHADVVLGLYREDLYAPGTGVDGATEVLVRKNRNGGTGYVDLFFYKQWLRFEDMLDPDR